MYSPQRYFSDLLPPLEQHQHWSFIDNRQFRCLLRRLSTRSKFQRSTGNRAAGGFQGSRFRRERKDPLKMKVVRRGKMRKWDVKDRSAEIGIWVYGQDWKPHAGKIGVAKPGGLSRQPAPVGFGSLKINFLLVCPK